MGLILIVVAVVAVTAVSIGLLTNTSVSNPTDSVPDLEPVSHPNEGSTDDIRPQARPNDLDTNATESPTDTQSTTEDLIPVEGVDENASGEVVPDQADLDSPATPANDAKEDGINEVYFAEKKYEPRGNKIAKESPYTYYFKNSQDTGTKEKKEKVAQDILEIVSKELNPRHVFAKKSIIEAALQYDSYSGGTDGNEDGDHDDDVDIKGSPITFHVYEMEEDYNKIPSAPLGGEVFVIAKTTNLDEKEVTITIQEKEELLVGVDAPLPVLEITEETENEEEQEGQAKGNESTELKANVEDGIAKIKIRLRPKSDEDLQKWQDILAGKKPKEEDEETEYESVEEIEKGDTGSRNQNSQDSPETQLTFGLENRNIINNDLLVNPSVPLSFPDTPGPTAPLTSIRPKARPEDLVSTPKTEFLWLKASANGDEQCHHGKFLNKDDKAYFRIGKNKDIIFPLLVKPLNDIEGPNKRHYWAADRKNQTNYDVRRSDTRQHAARDLETDPFENVVAIAVGEVLRVAYFYEGTWQITILHEIPDGRKFIVRYGELDPDVNNNYKTGDSVVQSQVLGKTGDLTSITRFMLHFELYSGEQGYDLTIPLAGGGKFQRRTDLIDPLTILKEGYRNTFEEGTAFNDWAHSPFGNRIALKESQNNYNLCNRRRGKNDYPMVRGFIIVDMTIAEVMALQSDTSILFATGRYQIVPETLIEGVRMLGLNVNEKYDEAMQDRLFNEYLIDVKPNRKPIINFLESDGSVEDAMYACAQEWAAIGVEVGRRLKEGISTNGQSYYAGIGGNRAHISPDEIKALLIESKANINN